MVGKEKMKNITRAGMHIGHVLQVQKTPDLHAWVTTRGEKTNSGLLFVISNILQSCGLDICVKKLSHWTQGDQAVVKKGWHRAGTEFVVLGPAVFCEQWWVPIIDPGEGEDPTFFKEAGLVKGQVT